MNDGTKKPDRPPDEERHGKGAPDAGVGVLAEEAYYAELFVDAAGHPIHAPRGWWHLKLWKGP
ncbi:MULTISPECIES: hypothetical protein [unclassified Caulobacter]|jgi:hypothetical protein|uniref:hypothetical protein n=1 Tax=unclassified Caulobacter TaxID=2648921 RepID=UPI000B2A500E|nr:MULTISPECIES: hypothetical protein [unclassified Caulobacter]